MVVDLRGKHALIGGSSSGIGKGVALQLAESGATVTVVARNSEKLEKLVSELPSHQGQKHQLLRADYTNFKAYSDAVSTYLSAFPVDILINNTQGPSAGNTLEKKVEDYQAAFDLLFKTAVFTTECALPHMQKKKWGRIVNVASVSVKEPLSYLALSNSIRAAVVTWGKSLASDVGPMGITVNSILTGYFDTERIHQLNQKKAEQLGIEVSEVRKNMEQQVAVRRIGRPEEYGFLTAFLASDKAAYITGTAIPLDGGLLKSI